jgi:hypothetical protein
MRTFALLVGFAFAANGVALAPATAETQMKIEKTAVCADANCKKGAVAYRPWELKLAVPAQLGKCTIYRSTPFLAILLTRDLPDTADFDCDEVAEEDEAKAGERARQKVMASFAPRTVFLRMLCVGYAPTVEYSIEGETGTLRNFMAVHAGTDRAEAERLLAIAKQNFAGAAIVSMTARIESADESCR